MLHHAADSSYPFPPGTSGHEMVGVVEAVGAGDSPFAVGDRVLSLAPGHKAMCECYLAPFEHVIPLPEGVPMEVLLQAQQLGTVLYASHRLPDVAGKNIAVIGQGSAGLWFNFHLRHLGAKRVAALDIEDFRLERSTSFGATHTINPGSDGDPVAKINELTDGGADYAFECIGLPEVIAQSYNAIHKGGKAVVVGVTRADGTVTLPTFMMPFQEKVLTGSMYGSGRPSVDVPRLLQLYRPTRLTLAELVTATYSLDDVNQAFDDKQKGVNARGGLVF